MPFWETLARYESSPDGVVGTFSDGTTEKGDVLVGTDGIHSTVRQQRAPGLQTMDAGVQAIYGRVLYDVASKLLPSEVPEDTIRDRDR